MAAAQVAESLTPLLSVRNLSVEYTTTEGTVHAVTDVSFDIFPRETLGLVGESGSGKTATCLAILGLLRAPGGRIAGGQVLFKGTDLTRIKGRDFRRLRGREISMILQESISALNPVMTIGDQISEAIRAHNKSYSRSKRRRAALELLDLVGFPEPSVRYRRYPHELSGGMRQRAMIAIAIANRPSLLIADEPTTALDVTIQAQIVDVLKRAQEESDAATLLVTHDLGLVSQIADRIVVMYAGRVVETGEIRASFSSPRHPYTIGLLESVPRLTGDAEWLTPIPGQPPSLLSPPTGCPFHPRCFLSKGRERCREEIPALRKMASGQMAACHYAEELEGSAGSAVAAR
jgi:oligopeptide/dipeptide ABC transporter ATP-binding protein